MGNRWNRQKELFDAASRMQPAERGAFLERECGSDDSMRQSIVALLEEHDEDIDPISATVRSEAVRAVRVPEQIGRYRIRRQIGEGGMGVVFEAQQENPNRGVALKVMRGGAFVDDMRLKMFQREAQSLGRLKHPNIAAIHEAGRTEDGQHFFAMELVRGAPLNEYVRSHKLSSKARLELFRKICEAIHYAHQRGVIHRDLKPSNILVDGDGQPKILDFGLARITDADVAMTTVVSEIGKIQGTLAYMSPEQARGNPDEIDVRSDVYSLGVLLFELMTDRLPYKIGRSMLTEALRIICEEPPTRPSSLVRTLRGDIETIALKALEKEPVRRYQSADAIAEDIRRYLDDQPILARPPSTVYQLKKMVARHRAMVVAAAAVMGILLAAVVVSSTLYFRAESERRRAGVEAASARQVTDFLIDMFREADPGQAQGDSVTARQILDVGIGRIQALQDRPQIQVRMMNAMGEVQDGLGLYEDAEAILRRAHAIATAQLGAEHPDTLAASVAWFDVLQTLARDEEADPLIRQVEEVRRRTLGSEHPETLAARRRLALADSVDDRAKAIVDLNEVLAAQRRTIGSEQEETMRTIDILSGLIAARGDVRESLVLSEELLKLRRARMGPNHPSTLKSMNDLASAYSVLGRKEEAYALYSAALDKQRQVLGDDHMSTLVSMGNLASVYTDDGRIDEAEPLFVELLGSFAKTLGTDHPFTDLARFHLARVHNARGRWLEAESLLRRVLDGTWDDETFQIRTQRIELGIALTGLKRFPEAERLLLAAHEFIHDHSGEQRAHYERQVTEALAAMYENWGRPEQAEIWRDELRAAKAAGP